MSSLGLTYMSKFYILVILFISSNALSKNKSFSDVQSKLPNDGDSFSNKKTFGHNMSPNSYTLNRGDCTLGPYAAACGVTDDVTAGTSTWLFWNYNMYTAFLRVGHTLDSEWRVSVQSAYLKTYDVGKYLGYMMESSRSHLTLSQKFSSEITVHYNITYEYFFDETFPHSMRREPLNNDPFQTSATSLIEYQASDKYVLHYELGVHGINYHYPQMLIGFSGGRKFENSFLQIGVSMTGAPMAYFSGARMDTNISTQRTKRQMEYDFSVHPEFQWQYVF
jgi:hypothetical protein